MKAARDMAQLSDIALLNPTLKEKLSLNESVSFVPMAAVSAETGRVGVVTDRPYSEVSKGYTPFLSGDLLIAKITPCFENGKIARATLPHKYGFGSTEFHVVRPHEDKADAPYLLQYLRLDRIRSEGERRMTGSGGQRRVPADFLARLKVPLPPLPEQRRVAAILDQAETLRSQRRAALAQLDSLAQSIFLDMFGDPVSNPKGWPVASLTEVCHCYSGGTPSKANAGFWEGSLPWFSAKDMKSDDLFDSEDHIADAVPRTSTLKLLPANTVAIVVRGMILAHTFPVCVLRIPATINQDLKALLPNRQIDPQFLASCLRSQSKFVLDKVSEAGHGTKRLDAQGLQKVRVLLAPDQLQQTFATRIQAIEALKATHRAALAELDALFASLQHRAFSGKLTRSSASLAPVVKPKARNLEELRQLDAEKGVEALIFVAKRLAKHGHYWPLKALYFADKHHLEHHGNLVYGETAHAMPYGPVPQAAYEASKVLNGESLISPFPDDILRAALRRDGDRLVALRDADRGKLSDGEIESLEWAVRYCDSMNFEQLKTASHDTAYDRTTKPGPIALADIVRMLPESAQRRLLG